MSMRTISTRVPTPSRLRPSPPENSRFVHLHIALDRFTAAAAALFNDHFSLFVILHFAICTFLQVESILPVNCNADPHVVVLNPSFTSSLFWSSNHSAGPIF